MVTILFADHVRCHQRNVRDPIAVDQHGLKPAIHGPIGRDVVVRHHVVEQLLFDMLLQYLVMVAYREAVRLATLSRHVAHVHPYRLRHLNRPANAVYKQIRKHARVETAWPNHYHVRSQYRSDRFRIRLRVLRVDKDLLNPAPTLRNIRFAVDLIVLVGDRRKRYVRKSRRQDLTANGEHAARLAHRLLKVASDLSQRRNEEVPEAVAGEARTFVEPILEQFRHQRLRICQRRNAIAQIAGWRQPHLTPEAAGTATVICDSHYRRQIARVLL